MPKETNQIVNIIIKITGLGLLTFMLIWHVVEEPINLTIILIPALMIGLDFKDIFNLKK